MSLKVESANDGCPRGSNSRNENLFIVLIGLQHMRCDPLNSKQIQSIDKYVPSKRQNPIEIDPISLTPIQFAHFLPFLKKKKKKLWITSIPTQWVKVQFIYMWVKHQIDINKELHYEQIDMNERRID